MNIALIIAGDRQPDGQDIPKQFIHVDNCPVIVHTMLAFQRHPDITAVAVVCLGGWKLCCLHTLISIMYQSYVGYLLGDKWSGIN